MCISLIGVYASISAFVAVWAFALRGTISKILESILFITVYRCYDVGDVVRIENDTFKVWVYIFMYRLDGVK